MLVSIMVAGAHLDVCLERPDEAKTSIDRRTLLATGCMLFTFFILNDAGAIVDFTFQLGWLEDGMIEPLGGPADNLTLAKADVPALVEEVARAAAVEIDT